MSQIRSEPCSACPYRADVASGVWAANEYQKLADYAKDGIEGPLAAFSCHATPDNICSGWALACAEEGSLALRIGYAMNRIEGPIPDPHVAMLGHQEACDHGMADIEDPSEDAVVTQEKLLRKHPRLQIREDA